MLGSIAFHSDEEMVMESSGSELIN